VMRIKLLTRPILVSSLYTKQWWVFLDTPAQLLQQLSDFFFVKHACPGKMRKLVVVFIDSGSMMWIYSIL
jgi:hypothetical protein